jgi:hypothetical protein
MYPCHQFIEVPASVKMEVGSVGVILFITEPLAKFPEHQILNATDRRFGPFFD